MSLECEVGLISETHSLRGQSFFCGNKWRLKAEKYTNFRMHRFAYKCDGDNDALDYKTSAWLLDRTINMKRLRLDLRSSWTIFRWCVSLPSIIQRPSCLDPTQEDRASLPSTRARILANHESASGKFRSFAEMSLLLFPSPWTLAAYRQDFLFLLQFLRTEHNGRLIIGWKI